jgi:hypothetical protein
MTSCLSACSAGYLARHDHHRAPVKGGLSNEIWKVTDTPVHVVRFGATTRSTMSTANAR